LSKLPVFSNRSGLSAVTSSPLDLQFCPPNSLLFSQAGGKFGCLEERTAEILTTLAAETRIWFQTYAYVTKRLSKVKPMKGKTVGHNDLQYLMNAIVYGPQEFCEGVGDYLAKCKMFLQDPLQCNQNVPYQNPHLLSRTQEVMMTSSLAVEISQTSTLEVVTLDAPQDLFSQLSDDDHLQLTETPNLLRTPLYK
jgi:SWI/SNF-related matrix-associated actin-dependent regulator of chromatin subfamily A3